MSDLVLKDMDEQIVQCLADEAVLYGKSVEDYVKDVVISQVKSPLKKYTRDEFIKFAEKMREINGPQKTDSTLLIREDRDNR